jgi:hypothetical protein
MQRLARRPPVLIRGEHHQISIGEDICRREPPLGFVARRVRQVPPIEIHRVRPGVINLDPVLRFTVLVDQAPVIRRQEFGNDQQVLLGVDDACGQQRGDKGNEEEPREFHIVNNS